MKKTSVITIIASGVIIVIGLLLCIISSALAKSNDVRLFKQNKNENGDMVYSFSYESGDIDKVTIDLKKANVNIIGNSEKSYAEILNFSNAECIGYKYSSSLIFEYDIFGSTINKLQAGDFSFNGLRDFFHFSSHNKEKTINIYLTSGQRIKVFDINIEEGNVNFDSIDSVSDYNVTLKKGDVKFNNIEKASRISLSLKKGNADLGVTIPSTLKADISNGNLNMTQNSGRNYNYNIVCEMGNITIGNENKENPYKTENELFDCSIEARVGIGDIIISLS